ncbi:MAG: hypothetical protein OHK0028_00940 [Deltaproteobacteria bacterium]
MNPLDLVLAAMLAAFAVSGIVRGLVRQIFSLGGIVAGHLLGIRYAPFARAKLGLDFRYSEVAAYAIVFLAVYLAVRLAGGWIEGRVRKSKLSGTDRFGGMVAGLVKGALLSILLVFLLVIFLPADARLLRESKAAPVAVAAGKRLAAAFPERFAEAFRGKLREAGSHLAPTPPESKPESPPKGKRR